MKRRLILILAFFCTLFSKVYGQSATLAINNLVKYNVITANQRPEMEKEVQYLKSQYKGHTSYRVIILSGLENVLLKKTFHTKSRASGSFISYSHDHIDKRRQDSINTALRTLLQNLKKADLLTDRVYAHGLKGIDSSAYILDMQMIGSLAEMSLRLEGLTPAKLLPVAEALHKKDIIADSSFLRLTNDINNGKIESTFQLNSYCRYNRVLNMSTYPDDPNVWLEQIHREIASILPGLNFTDFHYTEIKDTSYSLPGIRFKISLICNGHTYKHISLPFNDFKHKGQVSPKDNFTEDFYRIFNKVLTDEQSPYRIHSIMFTNTADMETIRHSALIALKDDQGEAFMKTPCMSYMMASMDSYDSALTSAGIDSAIAGWRKMGLFAHLSNTDINNAIDNAQASDAFFINGLLSNFPGVVYNLHDALTASPGPYSDILTHLAQITHGAFSPSKMVQTKAGKGLKLQYISKGKLHSYTFPTRYGWFDAKLLAFIKNLSIENSLPGNFYNLLYDDSVIYLTKQQYEYARENRLLSFAPVK